jgi:predicted ArsR family transcriptional regulator
MPQSRSCTSLRFLEQNRDSRPPARNGSPPSIAQVSSRSYLESVARLATLLEPSRRKLYDFVCQQPNPVSRDEAADGVGVSRAMAAFHLDRLVESGLLRADYRRLAPGRGGRGTGRPSKLYRRSRHRLDVTLPARAYELLARLLAKTLNEAHGPTTARRAGAEFGHALGVRARGKLSSRPSRERLTTCVTDVLADIGFEPVPARAAAPGEIRARNCPFDPTSRQLPDVVCQAALGLLAGVVEGAGANHLAVRRDPRPGVCCMVLAPSQSRLQQSNKTATGM